MNETNIRLAYRLRAHTGPCTVNQVADILRAAGCVDVLAGTETVYLTAWGRNGDDAIARTYDALVRSHGRRMGLQFITDYHLEGVTANGEVVSL